MATGVTRGTHVTNAERGLAPGRQAKGRNDTEVPTKPGDSSRASTMPPASPPDPTVEAERAATIDKLGKKLFEQLVEWPRSKPWFSKPSETMQAGKAYQILRRADLNYTPKVMRQVEADLASRENTLNELFRLTQYDDDLLKFLVELGVDKKTIMSTWTFGWDEARKLMFGITVGMALALVVAALSGAVIGLLWGMLTPVAAGLFAFIGATTIDRKSLQRFFAAADDVVLHAIYFVGHHRVALAYGYEKLSEDFDKYMLKRDYFAAGMALGGIAIDFYFAFAALEDVKELLKLVQPHFQKLSREIALRLELEKLLLQIERQEMFVLAGNEILRLPNDKIFIRMPGKGCFQTEGRQLRMWAQEEDFRRKLLVAEERLALSSEASHAKVRATDGPSRLLARSTTARPEPVAAHASGPKRTVAAKLATAKSAPGTPKERLRATDKATSESTSAAKSGAGVAPTTAKASEQPSPDMSTSADNGKRPAEIGLTNAKKPPLGPSATSQAARDEARSIERGDAHATGEGLLEGYVTKNPQGPRPDLPYVTRAKPRNVSDREFETAGDNLEYAEQLATGKKTVAFSGRDGSPHHDIAPTISGHSGRGSLSEFPRGAGESEAGSVQEYERVSGVKARVGRGGTTFAAHGEPQQFMRQLTQGDRTPIGVTRDMCPVCRFWFAQTAKKQSTRIMVEDPSFVRIFHSDGAVEIYQRRGSGRVFVGTVPPGVRPTAGLNSYSGVPW